MRPKSTILKPPVSLCLHYFNLTTPPPPPPLPPLFFVASSCPGSAATLVVRLMALRFFFVSSFIVRYPWHLFFSWAHFGVHTYHGSCIFCCLPIGVYAIFKSWTVQRRWQRSDFDVRESGVRWSGVSVCVLHIQPFTRWTDHTLDHVDPSLPLWDVVQDLYSTDPSQETCPRSCRLYGSHAAT